jgi:hypothetical protein
MKIYCTVSFFLTLSLALNVVGCIFVASVVKSLTMRSGHSTHGLKISIRLALCVNVLVRWSFIK